ncbi:RNA polymerase II C-terminal domain phosphatase-like 3 [Zingiber officinale]|uniref:RNA polymerase II C-terminal domain phosphatase-like 3 n=1 Tax=Zingiber officinale TaxID=94328 RepID=UPI001C4A898E|nr:RNA polymerase II C-terminal domain phosphatase-like 3 [Zingiber officinale]
MLFAGSNLLFLNHSEEKPLDLMARERPRGGRALDGETSDVDSSESLEEISAEDFKQEGRAGRSRVWMGYPMSKNYGPSLYNFAWAQAVQNKPLGLDLKPMSAGDLTDNVDAKGKPQEEAYDVIVEDSSQEGDVEMEKEEGELEEGEIELGSEPLVVDETTQLSSDIPENEPEKKESDGEELQDISEFDKRISLILEELDTITVEEAETSFEAVCLRLRKSFEDLKPMFTGIESSDTVLLVLVQQAVMAIQTTYSALNSVTMQKKDQNKQLLLRLLIHIKNQYSVLFTLEQVKEIDTLVNSLVFEDNKKEKADLTNGPVVSLHGSNVLEKACLVPEALDLPKLVLPTRSKNRVDFSPLLDLHADYNEDSLPSPTRENLPKFSIPKPIGLGMVLPVSSQPITAKNGGEDVMLHPYVTDALKAVSSYQLKFGSNSILSTDRLPSPTPSEDGGQGDDSTEEVSSSTVSCNPRAVHAATQFQMVKSRSSAPCTNSSISNQSHPVEQLNPMSKPALKPALKRRDPRLKFVNNEVKSISDEGRVTEPDLLKSDPVGVATNSKKHKTDESVARDHMMKKQRHKLTTSREMETASGSGWSEAKNVIPQPSFKIQVNENFQVDVRKSGTAAAVPDKKPIFDNNFDELSGLRSIPKSNPTPTISLPSLLKAVNPTILMQLHQMEQQRIAAENQKKNAVSTSDSANVLSVNELPGTAASINSTPLKSKESGLNQPGISLIPSQMASSSTQPDVARIRMKPRDPRRILHDSMVQKNDGVVYQQSKIDAAASDPQSSLVRLAAPLQLTKNLANVLPSSQVVTTSPVVPPCNNQPVASQADQVIVEAASGELNDSETTSLLVSEVGSEKGTRQSANPWGDVDHLFDGYNDEQKATIQKERSRRIAEQNKMFAARKLCLVLDLDHTLLNSAKFIEVDLAHEDILRRKEEQDKEMSQRHLFRFQHMGMWTKLRPGIWNFLEKASNLYELHLYTMGNKLYATEMAKVLDPTGTLFAGRVISKGDDADTFDGDERVPKSKDLDGVLGMESAVVIIDDSVRVWPHNKLNLIVVERYTYFPSSRRQFGLLGPSLLEIDHDERPEDGTLASSLAVIERLHQNFFSHNSLKDVDVRNILAAEQRKILAGCRIVFSRIFPVGEANPHMHPLWQTAEQFGAVCTNQIDEQVTHVVANSLGTDKVNWALSTGRFVVHPGWVEASALLYRRVSEHDFAVKTMIDSSYKTSTQLTLVN